MKYGVNMFIWTASYDGTQTEMLPALKEAGCDTIEVPIFRAGDFAAAAIRRTAESYDLGLTAVSVLAGGTNLISDDADLRKRTVAHMKDCIAAVAEAGIQIMAGPLYSPVGYLPGRRRTADEWSWAVDGYQQLGDTLKKHNVTIAVEPLNRFETYFLNTAADAVAFADQVNHPNVGLLIDTFHSNIEEKNIPDAYRTAARHLKHVHTCENDRGTPGSGHVDWKGVFAALKEIGYDGNLTIESFGFSLGEISAAASIWRDLAPTPDSIAIDGLKFLRQMTA